MTREEAIKTIKAQGRCAVGGEYNRFCEAIDMAISALSAQQNPLDRSRWGYCDYCDGGQGIVIFEIPDEIEVPEESIRFKWVEVPRYCPICGKPQNEEAWAEMERRINGGTNDI